MKKDTLFTYLFIILSAASFYFYKKHQFEKKAQHTTNVSQDVSSKKIQDFSMLVLTNAENVDFIKPLSEDVEKYFSVNNIKINYTPMVLKKFDEELFNNWNYDIGSSNMIMYYGILRSGKKIDPVFMVKVGSEKQACSMKLNVIVSDQSPINKISDLNNKAVAIRFKKIGGAEIAFHTLAEQKIRLKKVIVGNPVNVMLNDLNNNVVDAIFDISGTTAGQSNFELNSFGSYKDGSIVKYKGLKVVDTVDTLIPCKTLYFNQRLSSDAKNKLINLISNVQNKTDDKKGPFSNLELLSVEVKERIKQIFEIKTNPSLISDEVIYSGKI